MELNEQLRQCIANILDIDIADVPLINTIIGVHRWLASKNKSITLGSWEVLSHQSKVHLCQIRSGDRECFVVVEKKDRNRLVVRCNPSNADVELCHPAVLYDHVVYDL